ncbi:MAG: hypothetical protein CMM01_05410 [Rhodopirellula sp.]|nr:hypothetical protein [Rhodopirellula sp.]
MAFHQIEVLKTVLSCGLSLHSFFDADWIPEQSLKNQYSFARQNPSASTNRTVMTQTGHPTR